LIQAKLLQLSNEQRNRIIVLVILQIQELLDQLSSSKANIYHGDLDCSSLLIDLDSLQVKVRDWNLASRPPVLKGINLENTREKYVQAAKEEGEDYIDRL
jgi:hypothetical protein